MTETLPPPMTPAGCDLQDFKFMPLDVQRLRDSDLAAEQTPEENWAALMLWSASWHQVPAASVPDNEQWLAKHAGYMARGRIDKQWEAIKPGALRGFVMCSDGRFYHPVVAEKAREAWTSKLKQRLDTEKARIKKHNDRHGTEVPYPEFEAWVVAGCPVGHALPVPGDKTGTSPRRPSKKRSKGQGEGQGHGEGQRQGQVVGAADAGGTTKGTRLPADWLLPKAWGDWALGEYPQWDADKVRREAQKFRDHWVAKTRDATKLDWLATWRNWCASELAHKDDPKPTARPTDTAARNAEARRLLGMPQSGQTETLDA